MTLQLIGSSNSQTIHTLDRLACQTTNFFDKAGQYTRIVNGKRFWFVSSRVAYNSFKLELAKVVKFAEDFFSAEKRLFGQPSIPGFDLSLDYLFTDIMFKQISRDITALKTFQFKKELLLTPSNNSNISYYNQKTMYNFICSSLFDLFKIEEKETFSSAWIIRTYRVLRYQNPELVNSFLSYKITAKKIEKSARDILNSTYEISLEEITPAYLDAVSSAYLLLEKIGASNLPQLPFSPSEYEKADAESREKDVRKIEFFKNSREDIDDGYDADDDDFITKKESIDDIHNKKYTLPERLYRFFHTFFKW